MTEAINPTAFSGTKIAEQSVSLFSRTIPLSLFLAERKLEISHNAQWTMYIAHISNLEDYTPAQGRRQGFEWREKGQLRGTVCTGCYLAYQWARRRNDITGFWFLNCSYKTVLKRQFRLLKLHVTHHVAPSYWTFIPLPPHRVWLCRWWVEWSNSWLERQNKGRQQIEWKF